MNQLIFSVLAVSAAQATMIPALVILSLISVALIASCVAFTVLTVKSNNLSNMRLLLLGSFYTAAIIVLVCTILCFSRFCMAI